MAQIIVDGKAYPVSAVFEAETATPHPDLLAMPYPALEVERSRLLKLSDDRHAFRVAEPVGPLAPSGTLTIVEADRLDAVTRTINVHSAVRFLGGRPQTDFGFEGVDQVHGNAVRMDCGCIFHTVHDHHLRGTDGAVAQLHRTHRACAVHTDQVAKGVEAHWAEAVAHNQRVAEARAAEVAEPSKV